METMIKTTIETVTEYGDGGNYRLSTGGGHARLQPRRAHFGRCTAEELRAWAREHHVLADVEAAIAAGGTGEGSRGCFDIGTAAGMPRLTWRIEPWQPEMDPYHGWRTRASATLPEAP